MFNPGDQVKRIGHSWGCATLDGVYTVLRGGNEGIYIKEDQLGRLYAARHFELVSAAEAVTEQAAAPRGGKPRLLLVQDFIKQIDAKELADRAWAATQAISN